MKTISGKVKLAMLEQETLEDAISRISNGDPKFIDMSDTFLIANGKLWEIVERHEIAIDDDWFYLMEVNGEIVSFVARYDDGGTYLEEVIAESLSALI